MQIGQEATITSKILPKVLTAFERSFFLRGSIYVQAQSLVDVSNAIREVPGINIYQTYQCIPVEEWAQLIELGHANNDLGPWVCVCGKGKYRGDLAHVLNVDLASKRAGVLLVPRTLSNRSEDPKGKRKEVTRGRPPPCTFNPDQAAGNLEQLGHGRVRYNGEVYRKGLIELSFSLKKLRTASPTPSAVELDVFCRSDAIDILIMVKAWSDLAAASLVPGNRIQITSGEQAGLIGKVSDISEGVAKCIFESTETMVEVPVSAMRMYFCVGDYVQVIAGNNTGKVGGIIDIERGVSTDIVTFVDDASIKNKGVAKFIEDLSITTSFLEQSVVPACLPEKVSFELSFMSLSHPFLLDHIVSIFHQGI